MFASVSSVFGISFVLGIVLAAVILLVTRRGKPVVSEAAPGPTALAWWTFAFGLTAATACGRADVTEAKKGPQVLDLKV